MLVDVLVERGDLEEAERALEPLAVDLPGTSQTAVLLRHARGRLRFAQRGFGEALADLRAAGEIASGGLALSPCYLSWRSDAALAALAFGERDTALRLSGEELDLARAFGAPAPWGWRCGPLGLLTAALGVRPCSARRSKCSPAPIPASNTPAPWPTSVPSSVAATGEPRHANFSAKQSIPPTTSAPKRWPYGPRPSCRATGARPRRVLLTGLEALTASERRIAELAAEGHTNREIAQTLFVTARTVEGHLTHVFYKLDVKARTALPAALAAPTSAVRA